MFYAKVYKFRNNKAYRGYEYNIYAFYTKKERDEFVHSREHAKAVTSKEVRSYNFTSKVPTLDGLIMCR